VSLTATAVALTAVAIFLLAQESGQHATDPRAKSLDGVGVFLPHDTDGGGEIDGADGFGEGVAGFDEVFVPHGGAFVGEPFAETEKAALRSACGLVAQFAVANPCAVHTLCELASCAVDVESLKSE